jgi:prolyl 4-hydroxylase
MGAAALEVLSQAPRIAVSQHFLSPQTCDGLIRLARPLLRRAELVDGITGQVREDADRTNRAAEFSPENPDLVLASVRSRIAAMANVALPALDWSQVLHYEVGQQFRQHYDFFDVRVPAYAREVATSGQRALTVLIYLNDDYEGGHTAFPRLGRAFKGAKGDALVFWNVQENGVPDERTLHAGTAPTKGEKWLFSQWIRVRAA